MEKELRTFALTEIRAIDGANPVVEGHAAVFNTKSHDLGFREIILPGAFTEAVLNDDVKFLLNHRGLPLARTKSGTLKLTEDQRGLAFRAEFDANDPDVQRLIPKVKRGDLSEMSFAFGIKDRQADEKWSRDKGEMVRSLLKVSLFDVSAVSFPAYPATDLQARGYFEAKLIELRAVEVGEQIAERINSLPVKRELTIKKENLLFSIYDGDKKLASYDTEDEAKAAMAAKEQIISFLTDSKARSEARRKLISTYDLNKRRLVYVCQR